MVYEEIYKGYLIELFKYDGEPSWRILKRTKEGVIEIKVHYRTTQISDEIFDEARSHIDDLLDTGCTLNDYDYRPKY